jgi:hypothetical protein
MAGIDKIRPDFKGRDLQAAALQCRQKSKGYGRFTAAAFCAGDDESFDTCLPAE